MDKLNQYVQTHYQEVDATDESDRKLLFSQFLAEHEAAFVEPKYDGSRVFVFHSGNKTVLATKRNQIFTASTYPELARVILPENTILDAELMRATGTIFAYDMLCYNGKDFSGLPLRTRKGFLEGLGEGRAGECIHVVDYVELYQVDELMAAFQMSLDNGFEGCVVKAPELPYNRPHAWLKAKRIDTFPAFVIDYKETETTRRTGEYVTYKMGVFKDGKEYYICDVSSAECTCKGVKDPLCPFHNRDKIRPGVVLELSYQPTAGFARPRHPTIRRLRLEMVKNECNIEQVKVEAT